MNRREFLKSAAAIAAASALYIARFGERNMREYERRVEALKEHSDECGKER